MTAIIFRFDKRFMSVIIDAGHLFLEVPKSIPKPVAGYDRAPAPIPRDQRDRVDAQRREKLVSYRNDISGSQAILLFQVE